MSAGVPTGGPAFPGAGPAHPQPAGMTLRDFFATKCCAAMVSTIRSDFDYTRMRAIAIEGHDCESISQFFAQESYKQADAMLAERVK